MRRILNVFLTGGLRAVLRPPAPHLSSLRDGIHAAYKLGTIGAFNEQLTRRDDFGQSPIANPKSPWLVFSSVPAGEESLGKMCSIGLGVRHFPGHNILASALFYLFRRQRTYLRGGLGSVFGTYLWHHHVCRRHRCGGAHGR